MRRWWGFVAAALLAALWLWAWPLLQPFFTGGAQVAAALLARLGPWGPLTVIGLQVLQAVISPLPSWPVTVAAGALYGTGAGAFYAWIGGTLGACLNFWLARAYGRPFAAKHVAPRWLAWADRLGPWHIGLSTVVVRLVPFVSFDMVAYVAGVSRVRFGPFLLAILLGQLPGVATYAFLGRDLATAQQAGNWAAVGILAVLILGWLVLKWMRKQSVS